MKGEITSDCLAKTAAAALAVGITIGLPVGYVFGRRSNNAASRPASGGLPFSLGPGMQLRIVSSRGVMCCPQQAAAQGNACGRQGKPCGPQGNACGPQGNPCGAQRTPPCSPQPSTVYVQQENPGCKDLCALCRDNRYPTKSCPQCMPPKDKA